MTGKPGRPAKAPTVQWLREEAKRAENVKARMTKRKQAEAAVGQQGAMEDVCGVSAMIDLIIGTGSVSQSQEHAVKRAKLANDPRTTAVLENVTGRITRGTARALKAQLAV